MLIKGNALRIPLADGSVDCVVTSPPYWGLRDYGFSDQIGLESTPYLYVDSMRLVFAEVRRVLRRYGTVFLNLGDSYFSGSRRADVCDIFGKAPVNFQDRGYLCGNLCDVCRVAYRSRKSHKDGLLVAMLTASLCAPSRECKEAVSDHVSTSDSLRRGNRNVRAIQGQQLIVHPVSERLHASLVSMLGGSSPQLLGVCLQRASHGECLLCARSLDDCVKGFSHKSDGPQGQAPHNRDSASHGGLQESHNQCTGTACECCIGDAPYPRYTTPSRHNLKPKDLCGIPWRVAFALQADGWWLRSDIIWQKKNPMPESVTDRPTRAHEYIFLLTKSARYYYDAEAVMERGVSTAGPTWDERKANGEVIRHGIGGAKFHKVGGFGCNGEMRNRRSVWTVTTRGYAGAHYAVFPEKLIEPCILAGCPVGGVVFDPFVGSGTTVRVAEKLNRRGVGLDLSYQDLAVARTSRIQRRLVAGNDVI